jgi:hypothetical protein
MSLRYKGIVALVAIFVTAGIYQFALGCEGTRGGSEDKVMRASRGGGFKKSSDQNYKGKGNGGGGGEHKGGRHEGRNCGGNRQEGSGNRDQSNTQDSSGSNSDQNIDFSNYTDSQSLVAEAWNSYNNKDMGRAKAFAQETINRYSDQAKEQQASLSDFAPEGKESEYWALNDVATSHFILGSAYKSEGNNSKARGEFNTVISDYKYAQAYDPEQDIYWKVADAAQKELDTLPASDTQQSSDQSTKQSAGKHHQKQEQSSGGQQSQDQSSGDQQTGDSTGDQQTNQQPDSTNQNIDFSQYTDSASLLTQAWAGYNKKDWSTAQAFAQETVKRYDQQALEQQASLKDFAPQGQEDQYWALNDVATSYFIMASAYKAQGDYAKAAELLNLIISKYGFAQCYDPEQGIYWKVAEAAQKELDGLK